MTTPVDIIIAGAEFNLRHAESLLRDIPTERMADQPGGVVNHPAWTLGHMLHYRPAILSIARGQAVADPGKQPDATVVDAGSTPVADLSRYPSKEELVQQFRQSHAQVIEALLAASPQMLEQPPGLDRWAQAFSTSHKVLQYLFVFHEAEHLGQIAAWRRAAGMPPVE